MISTSRQPAIIANSPMNVEALQCLTSDQIDVLSRYVFDFHTEARIAEDTRRKQTTVSYQIRSAVRRLSEFGVEVRLPGRGRRRARQVYVDPAQIGDMKIDSAGEGGFTSSRDADGTCTTGRWVKSRSKVGRPDDADSYGDC